jgi:DNA repair exonuclease SbcCD ATPase subunit
MKILELEIQNIRGIRSLQIAPNGKNQVIWGPNGSGKSTVVDAIDFLLTGKIQRLMGSGTSGITLKKHGPHIQATPQTAWVRAVVKIANVPEPIELRRSIANPHEIICNAETIKYINPIIELASRGQHVLTRRELLKYVTAEAGKRAEEIQALLGISDIELIRKRFVSVRTSARGRLASAKRNLEAAQGQVNATLGIRSFRTDNILSTV